MPGKIPTALLNRSPLKSLGIRPLDFVLAGGTESVAGIYPTGPNTHIVWSHALDYEDFLKEQQVKRDKPTREYAVFLDQFMPFHPDYQLLGLPVPVKPNDYYRKLVEFFACLEDALGCQVVIAAHPRSNYESLPDYFNGRTMVKGQTVQLVRNAKIVLAHHSTSVNFANLYHKPVLFLNHDLDAGLESIAVENLAAEFGKKPINLNEPLSINWEKELVVDEAAYARYCGRYIKKVGSPEKPCWQIFADYVRTLAPA